MDLMSVVDLKHLQAFALVAEEAHFGRAAQRAYVSTATMSGRIKDLENAVGYRVFNRTSRRVELTSDGTALLQHVERALNEIERAFNLGRDEPPIRLITTTDIQPTSMLTSIQRMNGTPMVPIAYGVALAQALIDNEADLAVTWSSPEQLGFTNQLIGEPIMAMEAFVVIRSDDPLADQPSVTADQLAGRDLVLFNRISCPGPYDIFTKFLGITDNHITIKSALYQAGMAALMRDTPDSFTFASTSLVPADLTAIPTEPTINTPYWALARPSDRHLIEQFQSYVDEY